MEDNKAIFEKLEQIRSMLDDIVHGHTKSSDGYESSSIVQISEALAKAQGEYAPVVATALMRGKLKDYKYEDLGDLLRTLIPSLSKHGLSIHTIRKNADGAVVLHVKLRHASGEWMESRMHISSNNETLHEWQSLVVFHERSMIMDLLGCHPIGQDDDGQEAMKRTWAKLDKGTDIKMQSEAESDYKGPIYEPVTKKELDELNEELKGFEDIIPEIRKTYGIRTLADMDTKDWSAACKRIRYLKALRTGAMK